ncbi:MAG TPA: DUF2752 domain-containing protein [Micromonosporaceae bacterium]|nr:DUF2752 domain-containing protein [Micromonosporaceae bacterium]HCU48336.1 DUF2752 domain-containing protein [Micromonosporaceae bacterium]
MTQSASARIPLLYRIGPAGIWLLLAAAAAWVLTFNPTDRIADPTGPCLWHALTGINGPTCGGTRMFFYLIHGNLIEAARHHLAALAGLLYGLYSLVVWTVHAYTGRALPWWKPGTKTIAVYIGLFLLYAVVLRNLPWPPFAWFNISNLT